MPDCKVCGRSAGFWSDCHPACARRSLFEEAERRRVMNEARGEGVRQRVGAADFGSESVSACYGDMREAVPLTAICWVYRRRITRWAISSYVPFPVDVTHELVLHSLYGPGQ